MLRVHSEHKIERLKMLRTRGFSIQEIMRELSMPKTTVWHHIQKIKLSDKALQILRSKQGGSSIRKEREWQRAKEEAKKLLNSPNKHLYISIACLYWAEGSKGRCEFVNTDGKMIKLYLQVLRKNFKIPENKIQAVLRIYSNHDQEACLNYWSTIAKIPKERFKIFLNDGGTHGRGSGMCRIIILKGGYTLKLFQAIIDEICK